jgi:hypothetical protein
VAIKIKPFGRLAKGIDIEQIRLEGQGLKLCVLN